MESRRFVVALLVALAVYLAYMQIYHRIRPPVKPQPAASQPVDEFGGPIFPETQPEAPAPTPGVPTPAPTTAATSQRGGFGGLTMSAAPETPVVTLGGELGDDLQIEIDPLGAGVQKILLTQRKKSQEDAKYKYRAGAEGNEPYVLLQPVSGPNDQPFGSFLTPRLWVGPATANGGVPPGDPLVLSDRFWSLETPAAEQPGGKQATFATQVQTAEGGSLVRIEKAFALDPNEPRFRMTVTATNTSDQPVAVRLEQDGPVGIGREDVRFDMRRLFAARRAGESVAAEAEQRAQLRRHDGPYKFFPRKDNEPFLWTALSNKYFGVFTRPVKPDGTTDTGAITSMLGVLVNPKVDHAIGDLLARLYTRTVILQPGETHTVAFEVYAGPKDPDVLRGIDPAFVERDKLGYIAVHDADSQCWCSMPWLTETMTWLLRSIHAIVRNYGVAIIVLVLLVRGLLHKLAVFQQKSMYRLQDGMARMQPKMNAIKEQYASDKVRMNQEIMKLYQEEGVNPAAPLVSILPMLIQMPILISLWTALNTDIMLRHAPFDGWWITDLSAPDRLIKFGGNGLTIPILSMFPIVGTWFQNIPSFNLLPVLMGVSMWLQQKYMPKPHTQARMDAAKQQAAAGQSTADDQLRQQQMMAYMMSVLFPLMFYYMPSGLNLYWMATNVFGIVESIIVRKEIDREKHRRATEPPKEKKPSRIAHWMEGLAKRAQDLQKQADEISERDRKFGKRSDDRGKRKRDKRDN